MTSLYIFFSFSHNFTQWGVCTCISLNIKHLSINLHTYFTCWVNFMIVESLSFALYGKRQAKKNFAVLGNTV